MPADEAIAFAMASRSRAMMTRVITKETGNARASAMRKTIGGNCLRD